MKLPPHFHDEHAHKTIPKKEHGHSHSHSHGHEDKAPGKDHGHSHSYDNDIELVHNHAD